MRWLARAARQAEVREQRPPVRMDEDVGWLQVAVHDARVVRVLQTVADLAQVSPRAEGVKRPAFDDVAQRPSTHQRHGQERHSVRHLEVVDREDVRVIELGQRLGLGLESLHEVPVFKQLLRQRLERDLATQRLLHRAVHDRHPAPAEALDDLVLTEPGAGEVFHAPPL